MDETNPKDATNPATGTNPAPASPEIKSGVTAAPPAAVPAPPPPPVPPPAAFVPLVQPVQVPPVPSTPPVPPILFNVPVSPPPLPPEPPKPTPAVSPPPPPAPETPAGVPAPPAGIVPPVQPEPVSTPKPLRQDIAGILSKIKLPERITLKMSGVQAKPPAVAPPPAVPPITGKEITSVETPPQPAETPRENTDAQKEEKSSVPSVHTLKDDLQNVVRDKKMSLVRAVALESEKKKGQEHLGRTGVALNTARSHKIIGIAFVAMVFLALGLVAFFGVRSVLEQNAGTTQPAAAPSLIFAETTLAFPQETRTGTDLKRTLLAGVRTVPHIPLGAVIRIVPTSPQTDAAGDAAEQAMGIGEFLNAIGAQATPELIRSLRGDFFLGFHQTAGKLSPVIIIPVTSYERAFAGMLAWEPTMNGDLSPIFTSVPPQTKDEKGLFAERQYQDALVNNYDVRVLKDDSGATQLMYSFPTRTMLIIAESPYSFTEVLSRLRASRQL